MSMRDRVQQAMSVRHRERPTGYDREGSRPTGNYTALAWRVGPYAPRAVGAHEQTGSPACSMWVGTCACTEQDVSEKKRSVN